MNIKKRKKSMFFMNPYKILYERRNYTKLYNSNKIMTVILFINII